MMKAYPRTVLLMLQLIVAMAMLAPMVGCGGDVTKTEIKDPAVLEQKRQEAVDMSRRERMGQ